MLIHLGFVAVHFANQEQGKYYNGVPYTDAAKEKTDKTLGIQGEITLLVIRHVLFRQWLSHEACRIHNDRAMQAATPRRGRVIRNANRI